MGMTCVMVELSRQNRKAGHTIRHEKYNTGPSVQASSNFVFLQKWRHKSSHPLQNQSAEHLSLAKTLRRHAAIPRGSLPAAAQSSKPTHPGGADAHPGYAPQEPERRFSGLLGQAAATRVQAHNFRPVPGSAAN